MRSPPRPLIDSGSVTDGDKGSEKDLVRAGVVGEELNLRPLRVRSNQGFRGRNSRRSYIVRNRGNPAVQERWRPGAGPMNRHGSLAPIPVSPGTGCCPPAAGAGTAHAALRHVTYWYPASRQPVRLAPLGGVARPTFGPCRLRRRLDVARIGTQEIGDVQAALMPDGSASAPAWLWVGRRSHADSCTRRWESRPYADSGRI